MSNNKTTKTLPQQEEPEFQQTTLRVPFDVWRAVRLAAIDRPTNTTSQDIWIEAARSHPDVKRHLEAKTQTA